MKTLSIFTFLIVFSTSLTAQLGGLLKKLDDKISDELEQEIDDAFENDDPSVKIPPIYTFDYEYISEMEDKNGTTQIDLLLNSQQNVMLMKNYDNDETTMYLTDHERKKSLIYMEGNGNKGMTSMPYINTIKMAQKRAKKNHKNQNFKATGRTKMVAGYECDEYKFSDKKREGYVYVTQEVEFATAKIFSFQGGPNTDFLGSEEDAGIMLLMTSHKKGKPHKNVFRMECKKLTRGQYKVVNSEYSKTN